MTRLCRLPGCHRPARPQRRICQMHRKRIRSHGDPHFTQWTVADPTDIEIAAEQRRLIPGMTLLERQQLGLKLSDLELSAAEIARILGVSPRTVHRWRTTARPVRRLRAVPDAEAA